MRSKSIRRNILKTISTKRKRPFTLHMAPMIDMLFLLLIFFLVAAKFRPKEDYLPLQLSAAQASQHRIGKPEPLTIQIRPTQTGCEVQIGQFHTVQINDGSTEQDLAVLTEKIRDCMSAQKRFATDPVEIICDASVKWEHLARIYNMLYGAGLTDITFQMTE
ncbi:MAG: biopolymer transporter ExbD [Planctomycetota bacterium]|nr:MAG: biopolymer transporter ExbD [Planctomycetota bacterium]